MENIISINRQQNIYTYTSEFQFLKSQIFNLQKKLAAFEQQLIPSPRLVLPLREDTQLIRPEEIVRMEAEGNYTKVILKSSRSVFVSQTLKSLQAQVSQTDFIRIHASHLVQKSMINSIDKCRNEFQISLENGTKLPLARSRKSEVVQLLIS